MFKDKFLLIVLTLFLLLSTIFSYLSIRRVETLNSYYYDLGIMNQVVYNTSRGWILEMTNQTLNRNTNRLAIHFDPILALFAPLYRIYPSYMILLIIQSLIVFFGGVIIYLLGKKILKNNWLSLLFSLSYFFYFQNQRAVLFDFHPVTLATTFLLLAIYFQETKKIFWYWLFIFLSLLTKEHVGLVIVFYSFYLFFIKKEKKLAVMSFVVGLVFFIATVNFIIPYFRGQSHFALNYYQDFGQSPKEIFINLAKNPIKIITILSSREIIDYLKRLFLPVYFSLLSPLSLFAILPELMINVLSKNSNMRLIYFHYQSLIIPFLFYSAILGYRNLMKLTNNRLINSLAIIIFIFFNSQSFHLYNPWPENLVKEPTIYHSIANEKSQVIKKLQAMFEDDQIKIATTPKLAPFFTNRRYYYNFLYDTAWHSLGYSDELIFSLKKDIYKAADYVIINKAEVNSNLTKKFYLNFLADKNYQLYLSESGIEVYKKANKVMKVNKIL
jgi:uncharacterized membrane protein